MPSDVRQTLRTFVLSTFLPGEAPETLKDSTQLLTSGIIASLSLLELVSFIEEQFAVVLEHEDIGPDRMDTIDLMVELIRERAAS
jgi:acyl carrier protein